ncbi:MAG: ECF transporter S component [Sporolactobacillus sp.]
MSTNHASNYERTYRLVLRSILIAIIILQTFVPFLGYIQLGILSLTIVHITVIVTAIVLGPFDGALIGAVWGITSCVRAYYSGSPIEMLIFTNPLIAVLPRILVGLVAAYAYRWLKRVKLFDVVAMAAASVLGALINTFLVLGLIYVFYRQPYANFLHVNFQGLLPALMAIVMTNGIPEAIAAGVVGPAVAKPLLRFMPLKK